MSVIYINSYQFAAAAPLLLDTYSGAAAAYSLRQLRTGVTNVVRVRRSSDNTEQDFTATQITDGTLTAFCGAGDGFVRTWYDQSGNNRNLQQSISADQLSIVIGGALQQDGGAPAIASPSGYKTLSCTWSIAATAPIAFTVAKYTQLYNNRSGHWLDIGSAATGANHIISGYYSDFYNSSRPPYGTSNQSLNTRYLDTITHSGGTSTVYLNGALLGSNAHSLATPSTLTVGGSFATHPATGFIQELVIYVDGANRTAIEANINAHYGIF